MSMTIDSNDIKKIEKFYSILGKGYYCDSNEVTELYNKIIRDGKTPVQNTNCSTCIRGRVLELNGWLNRFKEKTDGNTKETGA